MSYSLRKNNAKLEIPENHKDTLTALEKLFSSMESKSGKPLSKLTISTYIAKIQRLYATCTGKVLDVNSLTDLKWLSDPENVIKCLRASGLNSLKDYVSPIVRLLKFNGVETGVIERYSKLLSGLKAEEDVVRSKNIVKKGTLEKFIPFPQIKATLEKMIKNIKNIDDEKLVELLICVFYYLSDLVPRNDLNIIKLKAKDKVNKATPEFNYISTQKVGDKLIPVGLVWNNYKTREFYKQQKFGITKDLSIVLTEYLRRWKKANDDFLLTDKNNNPFTKANMADLLAQSTKSILGVAQRVNLIRRTIISDFKDTPHTIQEEDAFARKFLHSTNKQREYFTKEFSANYKGKDDSSDDDE